MNNNLKSRRAAVLFVLILGCCEFGYSRSDFKKKKTLVNSIQKAMNRSQQDHQKMKMKYHDEVDEKMESWSQRNSEGISVPSEASSAGSVDLGSSDTQFHDFGEDQSGLDSLTDEVIEESTDVDFDKELRDVSSMKKPKN